MCISGMIRHLYAFKRIAKMKRYWLVRCHGEVVNYNRYAPEDWLGDRQRDRQPSKEYSCTVVYKTLFFFPFYIGYLALGVAAHEVVLCRGTNSRFYSP
jgi:hypothetical protein